MFDYNDYKLVRLREAKISHLGRTSDETQKNPEIKRIFKNIVKCDLTTDESQILS